jgi:hypothetical protein
MSEPEANMELPSPLMKFADKYTALCARRSSRTASPLAPGCYAISPSLTVDKVQRRKGYLARHLLSTKIHHGSMWS